MKTSRQRGSFAPSLKQLLGLVPFPSWPSCGGLLFESLSKSALESPDDATMPQRCREGVQTRRCARASVLFGSRHENISQNIQHCAEFVIVDFFWVRAQCSAADHSAVFLCCVIVRSLDRPLRDLSPHWLVSSCPSLLRPRSQVAQGSKWFASALPVSNSQGSRGCQVR